MTGYVYIDEAGGSLEVDQWSKDHHYVWLSIRLEDYEDDLFLSPEEARALATYLNIYAERAED